MRIDGSLKTVTAGVTSLDDKRHNGTFAKRVDNWRCDPMEGLVRRPSSTHIGYLGTGDTASLGDAVFGTIIGDVLYWVFIIPFDGPSDSHQISVFDETGEEHNVNYNNNSSYFNTITRPDDISFVTIGDSIYMSNKHVEVQKLNIEEVWTTNSMLVLKQAPASFSIIEVIWTASTGLVLTVEHTVPDFITEDTGTNTTAQALAALMDAQSPEADNIFVQGSTVVVERADGEYANMSATDGANDAVTATLNAETQSINNLPKYAAHNSVVKIRPDKTSDRGQFWMRATAFVETDGRNYEDKKSGTPALLQDATLVWGQNHLPALNLKMAGYQRLADPDAPGLFPPFGTLTPNTIQGVTVDYFLSTFVEEQPTVHPNFVFASLGVNPETFNYIMIVDQTTGELAYESQLIPDQDPHVFIGAQLLHDSNFIPGRTYDVYYEQLEDFFGKLPEVIWNECADPTLLNHLDRNSMPHVLGIRSDGTFITGSQGEMGLKNVFSPRAREAGNEDSNPFPEFVGSTINDLGRFQDRLVMLSDDTVSMTQTDKNHAWFRDTVTQQLATDPIGIKSTAPNTLTLDFIVNHNNDALLFSKNAQYKLLGSVGMTSQNAALPQTTSYDNSGTAKPYSNASDVFFPISYSRLFAGISRFSVDKESDNQDISHAITNHVQQLIPGDVELITASSTMSMLFIKSFLEPNVIYIYEYLDSKKEPQTAWSKWILPPNIVIESMFFRDNRLQCVVTALDGEDKQFHLIEFRLNQAFTLYMPETVYMDIVVPFESITTTITPPEQYPVIENVMTILQGTGAPDPGEEIIGWTWDDTTITLPFSLEGGGAVIGYTYRSAFIPSRRWIRDDSGTAQTASKFRITDYNFWSRGNFNVDIINAPTPWPTQQFIDAADNEDDTSHRVSFKQRHDEADIEIWTEDPFLGHILQIEWRGTYIKVGRRF